jgi:hypothetical protein
MTTGPITRFPIPTIDATTFLTNAQAAEAGAEAARDEAVAASAAAIQPYATRAAFISDTIGAAQTRAAFFVNGQTYAVVRDPAGPVAQANGQRWRPDGVWYFGHFGAAGDGVTDAGAEINAAFAAFRTELQRRNGQALIAAGYSNLILSGRGLEYRSTISINATDLQGWGYAVESFQIASHATGKTAFDHIGSRGGRWRDITILGNLDNQPRVGMMGARVVGSGQTAFPGSHEFNNIHVDGHFTLAAVYHYGLEGCNYSHCRFWNRNPSGHAGIHVGFDFYPVESDYQTAITGNTSYIFNHYLACEWRYSPVGSSFPITGITQAAQATVTTSNTHNLTVGEAVVFFLVGGMTALSNTRTTVVDVLGPNQVVVDVDTSAMPAFTSGGTLFRSATVPVMVFGRGAQHNFETCYIVAYGTDGIYHRVPDGFIGNDQNSFDFLFEGAGSAHHFRFEIGGLTRDFRDYKIRIYNTHCRESVIAADVSGSNKAAFFGSDISVTNFSRGTPSLFDVPSKFRGYDLNIFFPDPALFNPASMNAYRGRYAYSTGFVSDMGVERSDITSNNAWTPVVTSQTGAITSFTTGACSYSRTGKIITASGSVTITDAGTGGGELLVSMPFNPVHSSTVGAGRRGSEAVMGSLFAGTNVLRLTRYDGSSIVAPGSATFFSITYTIE